MINNKNLFTLNSDKYNINLRRINNFYQPSSNLTAYQKGVVVWVLGFIIVFLPTSKGNFIIPGNFKVV
jgi:hypothetical protein